MYMCIGDCVRAIACVYMTVRVTVYEYIHTSARACVYLCVFVCVCMHVCIICVYTQELKCPECYLTW